MNVLRTSAEHRAALAQLADVPVSARESEARLLHAVWAAGLRAVRQRAEAGGYARMASEQDVATRRAAARRRPPSWVAE